jgi:hypothetical protein
VLVNRGVFANERGKMTEEEAAVGYYTKTEYLLCRVHVGQEIIKKIERAITAEDSEENLYFCDGCKKEIK